MTLSWILFAIAGFAMLFAQNPEGPAATNTDGTVPVPGDKSAV
ncbi:MAG TPA: hypothetical protein VNY05_12540 [Candidatus Acidoferrales bacterium]|jgi:hypothetical protein|nr:hypothetical protein [Candidatus Acidoferrales bacterium]